MGPRASCARSRTRAGTTPSSPTLSSPDELVLRPERGMKKHMPDNINYVGEEAPACGRRPKSPG